MLIKFSSVKRGRKYLTASFSLSAAAKTSAGVYDAQDNLVKTLWSNRDYAEGDHTISWGKYDDENTEISDVTGYNYKIVAHQITAEWEGVIGNNSIPVEESRKDLIHALVVPQDYEFVRSGTYEGMGHITVGYNEGPAPVFKIDESDYLKKTNRSIGDYRVSIQGAASNSTHTYVLNVGTAAQMLHYVGAYENGQTDKSYAALANTVTAVYDNGDERDNTIDPTTFTSFTEVPRGIAVQEGGNHLVTSYPGLNKIRVFQKDGLFLNETAITNPGRMSTDPSDDSIWIIAGVDGSRSLYQINSLSASPTFTPMITGFDTPLDFDFSPDGTTIAVLDGGSQQRVRYFSTSTLLETGNYGQLGGHLSGGPDVTNDKFLLYDYTYAFEEKGFITYSPDGKLWIGDSGNYRTVILDAAGSFLETSQYIPRSYVSAVDQGNTERIFANWLEFSLDYTQPLSGAWVHEKNWIGGFSALDNGFAGVSSGLHTVVTLTHSNITKTIAVANVAGLGEFELAIVILDDVAGQIIDTGTRISNLNESLYADGSIRLRDNTDDVQTIQEKTFTGWDGSGYPTWGAYQIIATPPKGDRDPYIKGNTFSSRSGQRFPRTTSGKTIFLDSAFRDIDVNPGWHLGGVASGGSVWNFRASPSGQFTITGQIGYTPEGYLDQDIIHDYPHCTGVYDDIRSSQYGGNRAMTCNNFVLYGFHGEFWRGGQSNQWMLWDDNGLFLWQWGRPSYPWRNLNASYAGTAGNAFSPEFVQGLDGEYYLFHNDESVNGGVHKWKINNLDTIQTITISV